MVFAIEIQPDGSTKRHVSLQDYLDLDYYAEKLGGNVYFMEGPGNTGLVIRGENRTGEDLDQLPVNPVGTQHMYEMFPWFTEIQLHGTVFYVVMQQGE